MAPPTLQHWEIKALKEIEAKWYDFFYSIIFTPPGEIPQMRGSWTEGEQVAEMIGHLKSEYPGLKLIVVSSRCGEVRPEDADEWLEMRALGIEWAEAEVAYIKAGICADCGACSAKEAEKKCRPHALGETGDYSCAGERLWEGQDDEAVKEAAKEGV